MDEHLGGEWTAQLWTQIHTPPQVCLLPPGLQPGAGSLRPVTALCLAEAPPRGSPVAVCYQGGVEGDGAGSGPGSQTARGLLLLLYTGMLGPHLGPTWHAAQSADSAGTDDHHDERMKVVLL